MSVIKLGGSVLTNPAAFRRAAVFLRQRLRETPHERQAVVVSAQGGATDALLEEARHAAHGRAPDPAALDLLWSTGELRSVALLTIHLRATGVRALGLNVHETGLVLRNGRHDAHAVELHARRLRGALLRNPVVVVPGFLARRPWGAIVSLERGGSDLTAVVLAAQLGARQCVLVKDVPGYFDRDPNQHPDARHIPTLRFEHALAMADAGCDLVQRQAIEAAAARGLPLVIRSMDSECRGQKSEVRSLINNGPGGQSDSRLLHSDFGLLTSDFGNPASVRPIPTEGDTP